MSGSPTEAASAAIERLRALRGHAKRRRQQSKDAVRQLRERNRRESQQLMERAKAGRRPGQRWPTDRPDQQMNLYEAEDELAARPNSPAAAPPQTRPAQPAAPRRPDRPDDDDWSQETWLH